jgi:ABC-type branched-subunit amino acid transport system ATPase component
VAPDLALEATGIRVRFGGVVAVDGVDVQVRPGEVVGIIGPNGAGKTTLLDAVSGFAPLEAGRVMLDGADVTRQLPYRRARRGLARSFQDARLFPSLTVRETLMGAFHAAFSTGAMSEALTLPLARREEREVAAAVDDLLGRVDLERYLDYRISELSFGTTRAVELAWLSARRPSVLLLDEPASGLQQSEVRALGPLIDRIRQGAAVVLIDHDVPFVAGLVHRLVAMNLGQVVAEGPVDAVLNHEAVIESYLGGAEYGAVSEPASVASAGCTPSEPKRSGGETRGENSGAGRA